jgi:hypothetical protein
MKFLRLRAPKSIMNVGMGLDLNRVNKESQQGSKGKRE